MFNKEKQIKNWIDKNECLAHYYQALNWFGKEEINEITWKYFCQNCVFEIENANKILIRMKERDSQ